MSLPTATTDQTTGPTYGPTAPFSRTLPTLPTATDLASEAAMILAEPIPSQAKAMKLAALIPSTDEDVHVHRHILAAIVRATSGRSTYTQALATISNVPAIKFS